jgi:copper chaperone CopZ
VTAAVQALDPQANIQVDLGQGTVRVDGSKVDAEAAATAIRAEGYEVRVLQP